MHSQYNTPITRSYSNAVHPSQISAHPNHQQVGLFQLPPSSVFHLPSYAPMSVPQSMPQSQSQSQPSPSPVSGRSSASTSELARLERLLQESRRELEETRRRAREDVERLESEVLLLREQLSESRLLSRSFGTSDDVDTEVLRGKFEALTKINTTLRNENKTLNARLKHDVVALAEYDKLVHKLRKLEQLTQASSAPPVPAPVVVAAAPVVPEPLLPELGPGPGPRTRQSTASGRPSVDMKPLDLENLMRSSNGNFGASELGKPRYTARQTARLQAEDEEKAARERRATEASAGVQRLALDDAVDFASRLMGAPIPKVHALRLFRSVCGEAEEMRKAGEIMDFARLILRTF